MKVHGCSQDQYVFIHDAILESVTCGDTQINAGDLRRKIQRMSQVAQGKNCTEFQYQFQILEQVSPKPDEVISSTAQKNTDKNRGMKYLPGESDCGDCVRVDESSFHVTVYNNK